MPGATAAEKVLPCPATALGDVDDQRRALAADVEQVLDAHPLALLLTPTPGVGVAGLRPGPARGR